MLEFGRPRSGQPECAWSGRCEKIKQSRAIKEQDLERIVVLSDEGTARLEGSAWFFHQEMAGLTGSQAWSERREDLNVVWHAAINVRNDLSH